MKYLHFCALGALLAAAGCGGGASKSDIVDACKASVEAIEKELAGRYSSYRPATPPVMNEKLECCSRMIEGAKLSGGARSFLLKEFEYRTLRSTSEDQEAVTKAQDDVSKQRAKLSDRDREAASGTAMLVTSCTMRAGRGR